MFQTYRPPSKWQPGKMPNGRVPPEKIEQARELRAQGLSFHQIGIMLGHKGCTLKRKLEDEQH